MFGIRASERPIITHARIIIYTTPVIVKGKMNDVVGSAADAGCVREKRSRLRTAEARDVR
jgi:hypothetical protein